MHQLSFLKISFHLVALGHTTPLVPSLHLMQYESLTSSSEFYILVYIISITQWYCRTVASKYCTAIPCRPATTPRRSATHSLCYAALPRLPPDWHTTGSYYRHLASAVLPQFQASHDIIECPEFLEPKYLLRSFLYPHRLTSLRGSYVASSFS